MNISDGRFDIYCQAQSQLQLNWTELALISAYTPPTHPPGKSKTYSTGPLKMEDDLNRRRPQWKTTSMEDYLNARRPQLKTTSMEDDLNGRQPQWKTTSMENDLNGRRPQWKTTSIEDNLNGR